MTDERQSSAPEGGARRWILRSRRKEPRNRSVLIGTAVEMQLVSNTKFLGDAARDQHQPIEHRTPGCCRGGTVIDQPTSGQTAETLTLLLVCSAGLRKPVAGSRALESLAVSSPQSQKLADLQITHKRETRARKRVRYKTGRSSLVGTKSATKLLF